MLKTITLFTQWSGAMEREERRRCIPRGEGFERQINPTRVARKNVWQVLSQRPSRLAQDGGTGKNSNTMPLACKALRYNLSPLCQRYKKRTRSLLSDVDNSSAEKRGECAKEFDRRGDTQTSSLRHGWSEVFGVMCEEPVWPAGHGREQHGCVRFMTD